jgi:hypothetical protein
MKRWVLLLVGVLVVLGVSGCLSGEKPSWGVNVPIPINITGTVYKIGEDGFFMDTDSLVHPLFAEENKMDKAFIQVFPYDNTSISNLNLNLGARVRIEDAWISCKYENLEKIGCSGFVYRDGVYVFKTKKIDNVKLL